MRALDELIADDYIVNSPLHKVVTREGGAPAREGLRPHEGAGAPERAYQPTP